MVTPAAIRKRRSRAMAAIRLGDPKFDDYDDELKELLIEGHFKLKEKQKTLKEQTKKEIRELDKPSYRPPDPIPAPPPQNVTPGNDARHLTFPYSDSKFLIWIDCGDWDDDGPIQSFFTNTSDPSFIEDEIALLKAGFRHIHKDHIEENNLDIHSEVRELVLGMSPDRIKEAIIGKPYGEVKENFETDYCFFWIEGPEGEPVKDTDLVKDVEIHSIS